MEKLKSLAFEANKSLRLADHLLHVTYPLAKDNKLLISILNSLDKSVKFAIDAFIRYDQIYKRVRSDPDTYREKLRLFSKISSIRYGFLQSDFDFLEEIDDIIKKHNESPIEFSRKDKFIICYNDYKTKELTLDYVKSGFVKAKSFIVKLNYILEKDRLVNNK
jgi:hypothetical protein